MRSWAKPLSRVRLHVQLQLHVCLHGAIVAAIVAAIGRAIDRRDRSPRRSRVCLHGAIVAAIVAAIASCKHRISHKNTQYCHHMGQKLTDFQNRSSSFSKKILLHTRCKNFHLTLNALLHYLVKFGSSKLPLNLQ